MELCILLSFLSVNTLVNGWWSVITNILEQPKINIKHFFNDKAITDDSPSMGAYRCFGVKSAASKHNVPAFRTTVQGFLSRACTMFLQQQKIHPFFAPNWDEAGYSVSLKVITLFVPSLKRTAWITEMHYQDFCSKQNVNSVWQGPKRVTL